LAGSRAFVVVSFFMTQLFVFLCWVPFRTNSWSDTLVVWEKISGLFYSAWQMSQPLPWLLLLLPLLADTFLVGSTRFTERCRIRSTPALYAVVALSLVVGLLFIHIDYAPFISFQL
jgi:hypothetical protein